MSHDMAGLQTTTPGDARLQLERSREQIAAWLERDLRPPVHPPVLGCAVRGALPVLGALAQAWLQARASAPVTGAGLRPLEASMSLLRRHSGAVVVTAGVAALGWLWWSRSRTRHPPP